MRFAKLILDVNKSVLHPAHKVPFPNFYLYFNPSLSDHKPSMEVRPTVMEQPRPQRRCSSCNTVGHNCRNCPYKEVRKEFVLKSFVYITKTVGVIYLPYLVRGLFLESLNALFVTLRPFMIDMPTHVTQADESTREGKVVRVIQVIRDNFDAMLANVTEDALGDFEDRPLSSSPQVSKRIFTINTATRLMRNPQINVHNDDIPYIAYMALGVGEGIGVNRRLENDFDRAVDSPRSPRLPPPTLPEPRVDPREAEDDTRITIKVSHFETKEENCPICFEPMEGNAVNPICGHSICSDCMVTSLKTMNGRKCCMCRAQMCDFTFLNIETFERFKIALQNP